MKVPAGDLPARTLLVSDLDDTLTGHTAALARLRAWLIAHPEMSFAIATGRDLDGACEQMARWEIPAPAALITRVGTEIHWPARAENAGSGARPPQGWIAERRWAEQLDRQWQAGPVADALAGLAGLAPQPGRAQTRHKCSYTTRRGPGIRQRIREALDRAGLAGQILYSHGGLVDVIAPEGGKGSAALFVAARLGISSERVAAAGNSGNDIDLLQRAAWAIAVGNADDDLKTLAETHPVYGAARDYADGIIEGLEAWPAPGTSPAGPLEKAAP